jgi:hypothetical protein
MNGTLFHFSFFMRASNIAGIGNHGKRSQEIQIGVVETDQRTVPFNDGRQHVIAHQFFWGAPEKSESI